MQPVAVASGAARSSPRLHASHRGGDASGRRVRLGKARVKPGTVYFDGKREARPLHVQGPPAARRRRQGRPRRHRAGCAPLRRAQGRPGKFHQLSWDGRRANRSVPSDGAYEVRVGPVGHDGATVGRFEFHDHVFPVAGHAYGDQFGDPRSGGRVHEGQDLPAACGTPLIAARGGRVAATGYSDSLYGYYVLIDGTATDRDYFYAHLQAPTPLREGDRVRTGERVGEVGKTGNARSEFCQYTSNSGLTAITTAIPRTRLPSCGAGMPSPDEQGASAAAQLGSPSW